MAVCRRSDGSDVRPEACRASSQTEITLNICMLSFILTKRNNGYMICLFSSSLAYSILASVFSAPTANNVCGLYPFSPERETCCILPIYEAFVFYLKENRNSSRSEVCLSDRLRLCGLCASAHSSCFSLYLRMRSSGAEPTVYPLDIRRSMAISLNTS